MTFLYIAISKHSFSIGSKISECWVFSFLSLKFEQLIFYVICDMENQNIYLSQRTSRIG